MGVGGCRSCRVRSLVGFDGCGRGAPVVFKADEARNSDGGQNKREADFTRKISDPAARCGGIEGGGFGTVVGAKFRFEHLGPGNVDRRVRLSTLAALASPDVALPRDSLFRAN